MRVNTPILDAYLSNNCFILPQSIQKILFFVGFTGVSYFTLVKIQRNLPILIASFFYWNIRIKVFQFFQSFFDNQSMIDLQQEQNFLFE